MSAGDWGNGTFWRSGYVQLVYDQQTPANVIQCVIAYDIHVPSGMKYAGNFAYTLPTPLPINRTLDAIQAAASALSAYEGVPLA